EWRSKGRIAEVPAGTAPNDRRADAGYVPPEPDARPDVVVIAADGRVDDRQRPRETGQIHVLIPGFVEQVVADAKVERQRRERLPLILNVGREPAVFRVAIDGRIGEQ